MKITTLNNLLQDLKEQPGTDLFGYVVTDVIENEFDTMEDLKMYLSDVVNYGVATGIVPYLIYKGNIREVFTEYEDDIFEIVRGGDINLSDFDSMDQFITALTWTAYEIEAGNVLNFVEDFEFDEEDEEDPTKGGII